MKNQEHPTPLFSCQVKLSGVVTVANDHNQDCAAVAWKQRLISSFAQSRFKDALTRAAVLPRVNWFWHYQGLTQLCSEAIAVIAKDTNDYRQILINSNHLSSTLQNLDPSATLLLMISPGQDFAFGADLAKGEFFSTHIVLTQKQGVGCRVSGVGGNFKALVQRTGRQGENTYPLHPSPSPNSSSLSPTPYTQHPVFDWRKIC